jgi:hypothetical protein
VQYSEVGWICAVIHILIRWKHHFCQFLNVPGVNDARQNAVHKTELLMPKYSTLEVEMANEEKIHEAAGSDQIPSECSKQEAEQCILRFINIILFGIRNNCLHNTRINHFTYIRRAIKDDHSNYRGISPITCTKNSTFFCQG